MPFTPEQAREAARRSGEARRHSHAQAVADQALGYLVDRLLASPPPLTPRQRAVMKALLTDDA